MLLTLSQLSSLRYLILMWPLYVSQLLKNVKGSCHISSLTNPNRFSLKTKKVNKGRFSSILLFPFSCILDLVDREISSNKIFIVIVLSNTETLLEKVFVLILFHPCDYLASKDNLLFVYLLFIIIIYSHFPKMSIAWKICWRIKSISWTEIKQLSYVLNFFYQSFYLKAQKHSWNLLIYIFLKPMDSECLKFSRT